MKDMIIHTLKSLEEKENIKILFACESGSRVWGTNSASSDFDVRFIYCRKRNWYLQIYEGPDVIETEVNQQVELVGWDIKKAFRLLQKSNPTLLEWIHSPTIYIINEPFFSELKKLSTSLFSPITSVHHYVSMAKKNYHLLRKEKNETTKRYLNILRPLITSLRILEHGEMPANDVLALFHDYALDPVKQKEFEELIIAKKTGQHYYNSNILIHYIEETIPFIEDKLKKTTHRKVDLTDEINHLFIKTVEKYN